MMRVRKVEVVSPPLPITQLDSVNDLMHRLRDAGARGTGEALHFATERIGYAESDDGMQWRRPSLGLFEVTERIAAFDWDAETVKRLHLQLSEEMKHETRVLSALDAPLRRSA